MNAQTSITLVTPEDAPLAIFGDKVQQPRWSGCSRRTAFSTITSAHCETPAPGELTLHPGGRTLTRRADPCAPGAVRPVHAGRAEGLTRRLHPDRLALPGPRPGARLGRRRRDRLRRQARRDRGPAGDTAARAIAALAGAPVQPEPFHPIIRAVLLSLDKPKYLSAHITGGHGSNSEISDTPSWTAVGQDRRQVPGSVSSRSAAASQGGQHERRAGSGSAETIGIVIADDHAVVRAGSSNCSARSPTWRSWPRRATSMTHGASCAATIRGCSSWTSTCRAGRA